ncbi:MAG: hypothetical protein ACE5GE_15920, partial [Phycisphaerae bacterium]
MPPDISLDGACYARRHVYKHDFFAATGRYEGAGRQVIVKIGRREPFLGLPLHWIGKMLAQHEAAQLQRLADRPGVPALLGVSRGDALVHEFIPGHALQKGEPVDDAFFGHLADLLESMHVMGIAYVDLEKPQNILLGDDGMPYLIDFQISWPWPIGSLAHGRVGRWLGRRLQEGDRYHLRKLQRRCRPDQLSQQELEASYQRPWHVRFHRKLSAPLMHVRRWVLSRVDPKRGPG